MPSSCRIDFITEGGSALSGKQVIKINRSFPVNLQYMPNYSISHWEDFCNRIDSVLDSLALLRKRNSRLSCGLLVLSAFLLATVPVITKIWLGKFLGNFWYVAMFGAFCIPLFGSCYLINSAKSRDREIVYQLENICKDTTDRTDGATFLLRIERFYRPDTKSVGLVKYIQIVTIHDGNTPPRPRTPDTIISSDEAPSSGSTSGHGVAAATFQPTNAESYFIQEGPTEFISTFDRLRAMATRRVDPLDQV